MDYLELKAWFGTLPHTSPGYHDGDLYCNLCGEPWDRVAIALGVDDGHFWTIPLDMTEKEAERFKAGKGCPSCKGKEER